jgi:hypothetical protein
MPERGSFLTVTGEQPVFVPRRIALLPPKEAPFAAICWVAKGHIKVHPSLKSDRFAAELASQETGDAAGLEMSLEEIGHVGFAGRDGHPTTELYKYEQPATH